MNIDEIKAKVLDFVKEAHKGQFRKNTNLPYWTHPEAVSVIETKSPVFRMNPNYEVLIRYCVAMTHDVLEDCKHITPEILLAKFIEFGIDRISAIEIVHCVELLTKPETDFDIIVYLQGIWGSPIATSVKLADLEHNMSDLKPCNLLDKYKLCKWFLEHDCGF